LLFKHVLKIELVEVGVFLKKPRPRITETGKAEIEVEGKYGPETEVEDLGRSGSQISSISYKKGNSWGCIFILGPWRGPRFRGRGKSRSRLKNQRGPRPRRGLDLDQLKLKVKLLKNVVRGMENGTGKRPG